MTHPEPETAAAGARSDELLVRLTAFNDHLEEANQALAVERLRTRFRGQLLDTFLLYLFTYKMPVDEVRVLLDKVETQALRGFPDLSHASWRAEAAEELRDRWVLIENSLAKRAKTELQRLGSPVGEKKEIACPACGAAREESSHESRTWDVCPECLRPNRRTPPLDEFPETVPDPERRERGSPAEGSAEIFRLKERLGQFSSCVSSLHEDTRWILSPDLLGFVTACDRTETSRLVEEAWKTLESLESLSELLKESLFGVRDVEEAVATGSALRSRMLSWITGHGECPKCSTPRHPVVEQDVWLCQSCDFIYRKSEPVNPEGTPAP